MEALRNLYCDAGPERVGFVMRDESVLEVENLSSDVDNSFAVDPAVLIEHEDSIVATFHTHPGASCNLSGEDLVAFSNWPTLRHYIVGNDGVACYEVVNGSVRRNNSGGAARLF